LNNRFPDQFLGGRGGSQRSLYSAQQALITVHLAKLNNMVTLYKVLGGGAVEESSPSGP
jgi:multidrug efflux system outer membrane protein